MIPAAKKKDLRRLAQKHGLSLTALKKKDRRRIAQELGLSPTASWGRIDTVKEEKKDQKFRKNAKKIAEGLYREFFGRRPYKPKTPPKKRHQVTNDPTFGKN